MKRSKMRNAVLAMALVLLFPLLAVSQEGYGGLSYEEKQKLMEEHYTRALQSFNEKNFARAIFHWQEILKIDPEQSSPTSLIKQARAKLSESLGPLEKDIQQDVASGLYEQALAKCADLVEKDTTNQRYKTLKDKLENVVAIIGSETRAGKVPRLVRKGLSAHLASDESPKTALNSLRYAQDLAPKDRSVEELVSYLASEYPDVAKKEEAAPGMGWVEHKLFIALNNIYEGRHDLAIFACNEVLELEPDNVLALKRKGSAYFALKQKDRARDIWQQAYKLAPNDTEIKKFLSAK